MNQKPIEKIFKTLEELEHIPETMPCFFYHNDTILVLNQKDMYHLPTYQDIKDIITVDTVFIFHDAEVPSVVVGRLPSTQLPAAFCLENTRNSYHHFNAITRQTIAKTFGYLHWLRMHAYCGCCQQATRFSADECALLCAACQHYYYPKVNPSIIVLVNRGPELLLARSPHFKPGVYSALAGYVAPGETLEETLMREVKEEVNITVKNIRYYGSQAWPFPDTLMLGFYAEYAAGDLKIDEHEIEAAAWFTPDNLPLLPRKVSIAWQLINGFIQQS